jgi:hypothetical protein
MMRIRTAPNGAAACASLPLLNDVKDRTNDKARKRKKTAEPASGPTPVKRRFGLSRENHPQQDRCVRHYLVRGSRSVERPGGWYRPLEPPLSSLSVGFLADIRPSTGA